MHVKQPGSVFSTPLFDTPYFSDPSDDELSPFPQKWPGIKRRITGRRYQKYMDPYEVEVIAAKSCCNKCCLCNLNVQRLVGERGEYQRLSENEKTEWIRGRQRTSRSISGQLILRLQDKVNLVFMFYQLTCFLVSKHLQISVAQHFRAKHLKLY